MLMGLDLEVTVDLEVAFDSAVDSDVDADWVSRKDAVSSGCAGFASGCKSRSASDGGESVESD